MRKLSKKRPERRPTHPGEILKRLWLDEMGYTQSSFGSSKTSFLMTSNTRSASKQGLEADADNPDVNECAGKKKRSGSWRRQRA